MLFTSLEFLFLFLPLVLGVYYCLNDRAKNVWLLVASLAFYAWGEPKFVVVMIGSIVFNYIMAIFIAVFRVHTWVTAVFLGFAVIGNLSVLFVYKYANFVTSIVREAFPCWTGIVPQTSFVLPIGISFFYFSGLELCDRLCALANGSASQLQKPAAVSAEVCGHTLRRTQSLRHVLAQMGGCPQMTGLTGKSL